MNKKCKRIMSVLGCTVFIFMSIASIDLDHNNTTNDCSFFPTPVNKTQKINIKFIDRKTKLPVSNAYVKGTATLYIKEPNGINCIFSESTFSNVSLTTDEEGLAALSISNKFQSEQDYVVLKFDIGADSYFPQDLGGNIPFGDGEKHFDISLLPFNINP